MNPHKEREKRRFISCGEVTVHFKIGDKNDYGILEIISFFPLGCPCFAYGIIPRTSRLHAELKCNFLSSQSHKVIYARAVLVRRGMVRCLPDYFKCLCHTASHTKKNQLGISFMLYGTMIHPTLNSLFPLIGHNSEHSRACSSLPESLCTHSSVVVQISLTYSTNMQRRKHSEDLAVC